MKNTDLQKTEDQEKKETINFKKLGVDIEMTTHDKKLMISHVHNIVKNDWRNYPDEMKIEDAIRSMRELAPQDETETILMSQIIQLNSAFCQMMNIANTKNDNGWEVTSGATKIAIKLANATANLFNTIYKKRTGNTQIVKHVNVEDGGQAAFVNVQGGIKK